MRSVCPVGAVRSMEVRAEDAGCAPCAAEDLRGGDAATSAGLIREVLGGARGPRREAVVLNAAAGLLVAGAARDLREGAGQAAAALDDGRAADVLRRVVEVTRS